MILHGGKKIKLHEIKMTRLCCMAALATQQREHDEAKTICCITYDTSLQDKQGGTFNDYTTQWLVRLLYQFV
jgi:hypothetical protein